MKTHLLRRITFGLFAAGCFVAAAGTLRAAPRERAVYQVFWTATRVADRTPLLAVSARATLGREATLLTDSKVAAENQPAFPRFSARVTDSRDRPGVLTVLTKVELRETAKNKKGKLKRTERNIGALVPAKIGETQVISSASDPIQMEMRVERMGIVDNQ